MKQKRLCGHRAMDLGLNELASDPNFKFQMFSNDILSDIIVIKAVTEKRLGI